LGDFGVFFLETAKKIKNQDILKNMIF